MVYVVDTSGSMGAPFASGSTIPKIDAAKAAMQDTNNFLDTYVQLDNVDTALVEFSTWPTKTSVRQTWTQDVTIINNVIGTLYAQGSTNMSRGLYYSENLVGPPVVGSTPLIVLLSDGLPTETFNGLGGGQQSVNDAYTQIDSIRDNTGARIFALGLGAANGTNTGFDPAILRYAANVTGGYYVPVNTPQDLTDEIKAYLGEVCDWVDLEPTLELLPQPQVRLEELVTYVIGVESNNNVPGAIEQYKPVNNMTITLELQTEATNAGIGGTPLDNVILNSVHPDFDCVISNDQTKVVCTLDPGKQIEIDSSTTIASISARVPGKHYPDEIKAKVNVETTFTDIDADEPDTNNVLDESLDIEKSWVYLGEAETGLKTFTHVAYDNSSLRFSIAANLESDNSSDEIIPNPIQVPVRMAIGAEVDQAPRLMAEYCYGFYDGTTFATNAPAPSCSDEQHYIEGAFLFDEYAFDQVDYQVADNVGGLVTRQTLSADDINGNPVNVSLNGNGRYAENLDTSSALAGCSPLSSIVPGNCMRYFVDYDGSVGADYRWQNSEYTLISTTTSGGRTFNCNTLDRIGEQSQCVNYTNAKPGYYKITGKLLGDAIFRDEVRLKTLVDPNYGNYLIRLKVAEDASGNEGIVFNTTYQFIAPFVNPDN